MRVQFLLIGEGTTEHGLVEHLANLCIQVGATEASGSVPPFARLEVPVGHNMVLRLRAAHRLNPLANLYFVHRDADNDDPEPRHSEIMRAVAASAINLAHVAVVPIHETEAWLLTDEAAIRRVAGRPNGREPLNLPPLNRIEQTSRPKERLEAALLTAAQPLAGKRLRSFRQSMGQRRQQLIEELPLGGSLEQLAAWRRLRDDTAAAIAALRAAQEVQA
ncbi:DUF4276 family protein [Oscillochloris sp. ZM17-4]|uniref:DUF4276 family protein n=1 Tax=Oscillochloris sp. ZM17-4 TaxID=2866714 RepID=UPI001C734ADB|nr:DUF4276 family protein [Oscillochloris sp. ZM17-4]MBX0329991.1 DUF4276 family protein [Oscillochloris sp. ZM17-4]